MFALFLWESFRFFWASLWKGFGNPLRYIVLHSIIIFPFSFYLTLQCFQVAGGLQAPPNGEQRANKGWTCKHPRQPKVKLYNMTNNIIKEVADLVTANTIFCTKEVLTSDEAAKYLGISKSYLYKLTMGQKIPHYKPMGKMCYFNRQELEAWLQSNRVATDTELSQQAQSYCMRKGGKA